MVESDILLKPLEVSLVKAQQMSTDITSLIGGPTPTGESETPATPSTPSNPSSNDAKEFPETWEEKVKAEVQQAESQNKATSLKEIGILHFSQQHYVQAAKELKAALSLNRADTEIWAFYYLCLYNQGDRLAANNVFGELGEIIGGDTAKWLEVARLCEERDNFDGATHAYTQVIRRDPMNFSLLDKIKLLGQRKRERESSGL